MYTFLSLICLSFKKCMHCFSNSVIKRYLTDGATVDIKSYTLKNLKQTGKASRLTGKKLETKISTKSEL